MFYGYQSVVENDVCAFMDAVKPKGKVSVTKEDCNWIFNFENYNDYQTAEEWIYNTYHYHIYDNGKCIGYIYFIKDCGYGCVCTAADDMDICFFDSRDGAEDALIDYWESIDE